MAIKLFMTRQLFMTRKYLVTLNMQTCHQHYQLKLRAQWCICMIDQCTNSKTSPNLTTWQLNSQWEATSIQAFRLDNSYIFNLVDFLVEVINLRWNWCSLVGRQLSDQQNATPRCNQLLMAGRLWISSGFMTFLRPHTENLKLRSNPWSNDIHKLRYICVALTSCTSEKLLKNH